MSTLSPAEFATKWIGSTRTERAASQEHFIDLCRMLEVPTPNEADPYGDDYAFEKGAGKVSGGDGFADVWKRGHFAWEYKGKRKDLKAAYQQLLQYREALDSPPLLVVSDLDRFEVHTNFTNTPATVYRFNLTDLLEDPREPLRILRAVMIDSEDLRPGRTRDKEAAVAASASALPLLHWVIDRVLGERRARAFLLRSGRVHPLIDSLFDARVLHILKKSISAHDQPGVRYDVYKLDYGCYVDLITTARAPRGLLPLGDEDCESSDFVEVPPDDYRSIRRAILELSEFRAALE